MSITNPHDLIFKQTQRHIENAIDYIKGTFPKNLVKNLDLAKLKLEESSYTTEELKEYFSDLVYQCTYKGTTEIKITLLFEHKSFKPQYPLIKLLQYMLNIWDRQLNEKQSLTPIIPVLFYHGKEKWEIQSFYDYFPGIDDQLKRFIPCFSIIFTNITTIPDEQIISKLFDREANKVLFLLMKHIYDTEYLEEHLEEILTIGKGYFEKGNGWIFLKTVLVYLYATNEIKTEKIIKIVNSISKEGGKLAMTTAMRLEEEGIKKGKLETARNMIKKGYSIEEICEITGLEREKIEKLKKGN
jgi:predicted transposase/invertase (TIGR01784 family)